MAQTTLVQASYFAGITLQVGGYERNTASQVVSQALLWAVSAKVAV